MKKVISLLLAVLCAASLSAATGSVTVAFTGPVDAAVEYFVELRSGTVAAPVWTEVAKGPASPILFTLPDVKPGVYTGRVRARLVALPSAITAPSNEANGIVLPVQPSNATFTIVVSGP
ncbi:MAG TPA: hypothetical protein VHN79_03595 [Lacunisphaera sp.]|nr:hypothetical protein [Lacunisphaera sp.]